MGLDMYLEGKTFNWKRDAKHDGFPIIGVTLELGYWRKHPNLHGFIVQTFADGLDECQDIPLTADAIRQIIAAVKAKSLPSTSGFFFGRSDGSEDAETVAIFERALAWVEGQTKPNLAPPTPLAAGMAVFEVKPEAFDDARESRDVIYRASW